MQVWYRILESNKRALAVLNLTDEDFDEQVCIPWEVLEWHNELAAEVSISPRRLPGCHRIFDIVQGSRFACIAGSRNRL